MIISRIFFNIKTCRSRRLTLFDDVDDVVSVEAELVRVLGVVGVQGFALGHLGFGLGRRFGSTSSRRRPADRRPVGPETFRETRGEIKHSAVNIAISATEQFKMAVESDRKLSTKCSHSHRL